MKRLPEVTTGDVGKTLDVRLGDEVDGEFTNVVFTGLVSSIEAHVWRQGVTETTLTASFTDESTGTVRVQCGGSSGWLATLTLPTNTDKVDYLIEYQVTFVDNNVETWGPDTLPVRRGR